MEEEFLIKRTKRRINFTVIDNGILHCKTMSFEAKGFLCWVLSLPDDWILYKKYVMENFDIGRDKLARIFLEIEQAGYLCKVEKVRDKGKFAGMSYLFYDNNVTDAGLPSTVKPDTANPQLLNTNIIQRTNNTKDGDTVFPLEAPSSQKKKEVGLEFAEFWKWYPRKVAKGAAEKAWRSIPVSKYPQVLLMAEAFSKTPFKDISFCPHPATWLNAKRWEDEEPENPNLHPYTPDQVHEIKRRLGRDGSFPQWFDHKYKHILNYQTLIGETYRND